MRSSPAGMDAGGTRHGRRLGARSEHQPTSSDATPSVGLEKSAALTQTQKHRMWEARTRDELLRIGLRRPAIVEGLTPAQQRVAELVASGMSNREIASTLYMSQRSVEAHLTKVYREFGVRSRAQLVATMSAPHVQSRAHAKWHNV